MHPIRIAYFLPFSLDDILFVMISLYDLLTAANGQLFGEPVAHLFKDFTLDPEQVGDALLYVALRSGQGDVQRSIEQAIHNGIAGVLCAEPPTCDTDGVTVVMSRDPQKALLDWGSYILKKLDVKTIAVAGTIARATTLAATAQVLGRRYTVYPAHTAGDGQLQLIMALPRLRPGNQFIVMDMSSSRPGEMRQMIQAFEPDVVLIPHIHCNFTRPFENCDQVIQEQAALVTERPADSLTILNYDDDYSISLLPQAKTQVQTVGIDRFGADVLAFNVLIAPNRTGFDLRYESERFLGRWTSLLGKHNLYGALAALLVGLHYDVPLSEGLRALTNIRPLPGQMNALDGLNGSLLIDDSERADVSSTLAALDWLQAVKVRGQRTFFVLGDLDANGSNGYVAGLRDIGERAVQVADVFITQGTDAAVAAQAARDLALNNGASSTVHAAYGAQDTVQTLTEMRLNPGDVVLVKGGSTARMEQVVGALLENTADREQLPRQDLADNLAGTPRPLPLRPSWAEVQPEILAQNVRTLRQMLSPEVTLMAVVKANAYGHGAIMAAHTALLNGAGYLAVASMAEAMELRHAGINAPILILSYTPESAVQQAIQQELTVTVFDLESAQQYQRAAALAGGKLRCHVKVDTGMGRLGMLADDAIRVFRHLAVMQNLDIEGIFTHFSAADDDPDHTQDQISSFKRVVRALRAGGFQFKYIHAANSAGTLLSPDLHLNMVRPGLMMYGVNPSSMQPLPEGIAPMFTWKTTVLQVKRLPPGHPVGYGNTYRTRTNETIAILPVGYADGLRRSPRTWRYVLVHGQRAPLIGRVSMEKCAISVSHISGVANGDEVVLIGQQGEEAITLDEVARWLETIPYEVLVSVLPRLPRL